MDEDFFSFDDSRVLISDLIPNIHSFSDEDLTKGVNTKLIDESLDKGT